VSRSGSSDLASYDPSEVVLKIGRSQTESHLQHAENRLIHWLRRSSDIQSGWSRNVDRSSRGCREHVARGDGRSEPAGAMGSFASGLGFNFDQTVASSQPDLCNRRLPQSRFVTQEAFATSRPTRR